MKKTFFARYALLVLCVVFFLAPILLRGARNSLERMKNDVKDWLPDDFEETRVLDWFRAHFLSEQFVVVSWEGCTADSESFNTLYKKLTSVEVPPSQREQTKLAVGESSRQSTVDGEDNKEGELVPPAPADDFIGQRLGLFYTGDDYEDWGGRGEKWLQGDNLQWYFITPKGNLFRWQGSDSWVVGGVRAAWRAVSRLKSAKGEHVTSFGSQDGPWYYKDPRRLTARFFKTVTTGPDVLENMTREGGTLAGDPEEALSRLKGTLYGPDGQLTCLFVTLTDKAKEDLRRVLGRPGMGRPMGQLIRLAEESGIDPADLHLGGPPVDNVSIDEEGEITLVRLVGLCMLLGLGLSYLCFRSIRATLMVFFVGGVSAVASLAILWWAGASVDAVLMSMPSVVYVLGLSGAVHIMNYYRDAVDEHGLAGAPEQALRHSFKPCTLAALTTALGLLSLCTSEILPIRKFGFFSALGVLATLLLLFTFLPAALQMWPPRRRTVKETGGRSGALGQVLARLFQPVAEGIVRHNGWVVAGCMVVFVLFAAGLFRINTSVQLLKMFDADSKIIQDYHWLETNLGRLVPMEVVVRVDRRAMQPPASQLKDLDEQAKREARFQLSFLDRMEITDRVRRVIEQQFGEAGTDVVGRAMSAVTFAPPLPPSGGGLGRAGAKRWTTNIQLERYRDEFLDSDYLRFDQKYKAELWRISLRLGALNDVDYGEFITEVKQTVEPVIAAYLYRDKILRKIDEQRGDKGYANSRVFVLGAPYKEYALAAKERKEWSQKTNSNAGVNGSSTAARGTTAPINKTKIFAQTLRHLLRNSRIRFSYHDPVTEPPTEGFATSDDWGRRLSKKDCVVLVTNDPAYDLAFLGKHAPLLIDALDHQKIFSPEALPDADDADEGPAICAYYTGVVPLVYKAQRTLLTSLIESIGWAFALIALVMMLQLRSVSAGLFSMLPNVFPVVIIFGAMGWSQILVDIGSMMTASVAMGVAVDDTIHFLNWFRQGLDEGMDRRQAIMLAYRRVATAMFQTTAIAGLGLAIFAFSTFTPTQRFGYLMLMLLAAALVGDLVFLPALLAGPVGRVFRPGKGRKKLEDAGSPPREESPPRRQPSSTDEQAVQPLHAADQSNQPPPRTPHAIRHNEAHDSSER